MWALRWGKPYCLGPGGGRRDQLVRPPLWVLRALGRTAWLLQGLEGSLSRSCSARRPLPPCPRYLRPVGPALHAGPTVTDFPGLRGRRCGRAKLPSRREWVTLLSVAPASDGHLAGAPLSLLVHSAPVWGPLFSPWRRGSALVPGSPPARASRAWCGPQGTPGHVLRLGERKAKRERRAFSGGVRGAGLGAAYVRRLCAAAFGPAPAAYLLGEFPSPRSPCVPFASG